MRKPVTLVIVLAMMVHTTNAAFTESKIEKKTNTITVFTSAQQKTADEFFITLSRKEYEQLTGRHLTLFKRITYALLRRRFKPEKETTGFSVAGFLMGFFLGPLGVLFAGITNDSNKLFWSLIGFGALVVVAILIYRSIAGL